MPADDVEITLIAKGRRPFVYMSSVETFDLSKLELENLDRLITKKLAKR